MTAQQINLVDTILADLEIEAGHRAATEGRAGKSLVTLSYAQSLDGCLAQERGRPTRISGDEAMRLTHRLRAAHQAILVGVGTVLADDPQLTVRLVQGDNPQPVILDSRLRTPDGARLLERKDRPVWIAAGSEAPARRRLEIEGRGGRVLTGPTDQNGMVDLHWLLGCLWAEGIRSIMVEGGAGVITSFLRQNLADQAVITVAPVWLGGLHVIDASSETGDLPAIVAPRSAQLGRDIIVWGRLEGK